MSLLYRLLCGLLGLLVRQGDERELEIIVLRHQLAILSRGGKRPQYTTIDRALLAAARRLLPPERCSEDVPRAVDFRRRSWCDGQAVRTIAASLLGVCVASE